MDLVEILANDRALSHFIDEFLVFVKFMRTLVQQPCPMNLLTQQSSVFERWLHVERSTLNSYDFQV